MSTANSRESLLPRTPAEWALDGSLSGGLLLALAIVYVMNLGGLKDGQPLVTTPAVSTEEIPVVDHAPPLRMAVTTKEYDDLGHTLTQLGPRFSQFKVVSLDDLLNPQAFDEFDILFLTCGTVPSSWAEKEIGESSRKGTVSITVKAEIYDKFCDNLSAFVKRGGTLYASDLRLSIVQRTFRDMSSPGYPGEGDVQSVKATVDASLSSLIGNEIDLKFDKEGWAPAAFDESQVDVLLKGSYKNMDGHTTQSPLLVRFRHGEGTVIFTSFHNEKQNSEVEQKLLKALVFATILAKTQSTTTKTLVQGGFKPVGNSMIGAAGGSQAVTQTYRAAKAVTLKFSVGFEANGGTLKLTVIPPNGKKSEQRGNSSFDLEVACDQAGEWKYTIEALKSPPGDFPFTLTFGEK